jgi:histidine triad (HIT) family protein
MDSSCIFCKIIKKEIPSTQIYEDEDFLAFLDIEPVSNGHLLIVPKKHIVWMQDADNGTVSEIFKLSKKLMLSIKNGLSCDYVQVSVGGTDVPHFHIHLIPRYLDDGLPKFVTKKYQDGEAERVAKKIISML